jgi:enoyl-CoA hydratase/carnithine racemase
MSSSLHFENIEYEVNEDTAWIRLNRPDRLNALTSAFYAEVKAAVRTAELDADVNTLVILGSGRAFATGGDLDEVLGLLDTKDYLGLHAMNDSAPYDAMWNSTKTLIAAVNGICMAGGLILALSCDIQIAAQSAVFSVPEAKTGIADRYTAGVLVPRLSLSKAKYLAFTGKAVSAVEAERIGLVTEVVPDDRLIDRVEEVLAELRETSPAARRMYKAYFNQLTPRADGDAFMETMRTPEVVERLYGFANRKRKS